MRWAGDRPGPFDVMELLAMTHLIMAGKDFLD